VVLSLVLALCAVTGIALLVPRPPGTSTAPFPPPPPPAGSFTVDTPPVVYLHPPPAGSFTVDTPPVVYLHRREKKTISLHLHRTNFSDRITFVPVDTEHVHLRPLQAAGASGSDDLSVLVEADDKAAVGTERQIPIHAQGGERDFPEVLKVVVLFLPVLRGGQVSGTDPEPKPDANDKWYHPVITSVSPGGQSVEFRLIPKRGPDDDPASFYMMTNKVSVGLFQEFVDLPGNQGRRPDAWTAAPPANNLPAFNVKWADAGDFAQWLGGELPSPEEWQKAAGFKDWMANGKDPSLGPFQGRWPSKDPLDIAVGRLKRPRPVGEATADVSQFGCHDMAGNGQEWTRAPATHRANSVVVLGCGFDAPKPVLFKDFRPSEKEAHASAVQSIEEGADDIGFRVVIRPK
jgi:hypothetical protein